MSGLKTILANSFRRSHSHIFKCFAVENLGKSTLQTRCGVFSALFAGARAFRPMQCGGSKYRTTGESSRPFVGDVLHQYGVYTGLSCLALAVAILCSAKLGGYGTASHWEFASFSRRLARNGSFTIFEEYTYITVRGIIFSAPVNCDDVCLCQDTGRLLHLRRESPCLRQWAQNVLMNFFGPEKYCTIRLTTKIDWKAFEADPFDFRLKLCHYDLCELRYDASSEF